jgi:CheY-like chemotaxis protein
MNAILGFAELLCETEMDPSQRNFLHLILDSGKTLLALINDILDFSKIEAGKLTVEKIPFSLADVLSGVKSLLQPAAEKKNLDFKILPGGRLPAEVRSDPVRLRQCLINLIGNAIKFTHSGHVHLNVSMDPIPAGPMLHFDLEDTGIGIPLERQQEIFEPFTQSDSSTTRHYGGTGLGLTITRRLAELMGGSLSVRSEVGKGSIFTLCIPAGVDLNALTEQPTFTHALFSDSRAPMPAAAEECRFWGHILVAEDALASQILIRKLLEKYGLEVTVVSDGRLAAEEGISGAYDLIFMDMHMPELNGYDATRLLREQGCVTPIIALTASAMKGDEDKCMKAGCDSYLSKPIDRRELFRTLQRYLLADPAFEEPYQKARNHSQADPESD